MIYLDLRDKMSVRALNYSLSLTDKLFDQEVNGYIKVCIISKFLEISRKNDLGFDGRIVYYIDENYDLNDKSLYSFINKDSSELSVTEVREQKLVKELIEYLVLITKEVYQSTDAQLIRKKALNALSYDLGIEIILGEEDSNDIYNIYLTESSRLEEEMNSKLSLAKIG